MTSVVENVSRTFHSKNNGVSLMVPTVFSSIFLQMQPLVELAADQVSIELFKGNRKVAPLVARNGVVSNDNEIVQPGKTGVNDYVYGLVEQEMALHAGTLNKRVPGEDPFKPVDKDGRLMFWMQELLTDVVKRVLRRLELLAYQSFFDAEMDLGEQFQGEAKLIFPRDAALKNRTVAVSWATAASATPWADLGLALREIIVRGQVNASMTNVFSFMSYSTIEDLKAIYRSQKGADIEAQLFYEYDFNRATVPSELKFLIDNGATYVGWVKTEWGQNPVHIFTTSGVYDNGTSTVDYLTGETISLCVNSPEFFKTFFGAGTFMNQDESFYTKTFGDYTGDLGLEDATQMGNTPFPAEVFLPNVYPLDKNAGIGGMVQTAPVFAPMQVNCVATIDTKTTA